jgi:phosphatidylserine decarboxylase
MRIDPAGYPFIGAAGLLALLLAVTRYRVWGFAPLLIGLFFLYFFRDPDRVVRAGPGEVVSPADGRVLIAGDAKPASAPPGQWRQISIFLSPTDVHVNRIPIAGRVVRVERHPGRFLPAYRPEAATQNERTEVWIEWAGELIVVRQVVGVLARRIVTRLEPGAEVQTGQRYGIMKFGSRIDLYLPLSATMLVAPGARVVGAETILARLAVPSTETRE